MKKLALLLAFAMLLPMMFSCGQKSDESKSESKTVSETSKTESLTTSGEESMPDTNYVDKIERHPTTIVKKDDSTYVITTELYDGVYTRTFYKRSWGTWNIGSMTFKPKDGSEITFVTASTDWEYVFRAGKTADTINFCGGNHENEKMIDIKFFDGETDKELSLDDKKPVTVDLLKIIENTQIHYNKTPNDVFAKVERIYYYAGKSIYNECNYELVQDTHFSLSYTAMFPINKEYGTRIIYNNVNGTKREWTSETVESYNYKNFEGPFDKGNAALSVNIFGYKDPRYQFGIEVFTKEDSTDNFKNSSKTFYWDMSKGQNKLYFSRFPDTGSSLVKKGEKWNTLTKWEFNFVEDAVYEEPETSKAVSK